MTNAANPFTFGGNRAVRSPNACRFVGEGEVWITREGSRVVLQPRPIAWSERFACLAGSTAKFPYPEEPPAVARNEELRLENWRS